MRQLGEGRKGLLGLRGGLRSIFGHSDVVLFMVRRNVARTVVSAECPNFESCREVGLEAHVTCRASVLPKTLLTVCVFSAFFNASSKI